MPQCLAAPQRAWYDRHSWTVFAGSGSSDGASTFSWWASPCSRCPAIALAGSPSAGHPRCAHPPQPPRRRRSPLRPPTRPPCRRHSRPHLAPPRAPARPYSSPPRHPHRRQPPQRPLHHPPHQPFPRRSRRHPARHSHTCPRAPILPHRRPPPRRRLRLRSAKRRPLEGVRLLSQMHSIATRTGSMS